MLVLAFLLAALGFLAALRSAGSARRAWRQTRRANVLVSELRQRADDQEAAKETALRLFGEQRQLRLDEYETFSNRLLILQTTYEEALTEYRTALRAYREALSLPDEDAPRTH